MTEEIINDIERIIEELRGVGVPAVFLAFNDDEFFTVKNCKTQTAAQLVLNQVESTEEMKEAFVTELEQLTIKELKEQSTKNEKV